MSLPWSARRRWRLETGGKVGYLDLGNTIVIVPGGIAEVQRDLLDAVTGTD